MLDEVALEIIRQKNKRIRLEDLEDELAGDEEMREAHLRWLSCDGDAYEEDITPEEECIRDDKEWIRKREEALEQDEKLYGDIDYWEE